MRTAEVTRNTKETQIRVRVNLDGKGAAKLSTGLPFLEHMLDQVARHGMLDIEVEPARSATRRGCAVSVTPMCRWTRRCRG
jgi:imidazoleglycerol phosphate dehydratase HisB